MHWKVGGGQYSKKYYNLKKVGVACPSSYGGAALDFNSLDFYFIAWLPTTTRCGHTFTKYMRLNNYPKC